MNIEEKTTTEEAMIIKTPEEEAADLRDWGLIRLMHAELADKLIELFRKDKLNRVTIVTPEEAKPAYDSDAWDEKDDSEYTAK